MGIILFTWLLAQSMVFPKVVAAIIFFPLVYTAMPNYHSQGIVYSLREFLSLIQIMPGALIKFLLLY